MRNFLFENVAQIYVRYFLENCSGIEVLTQINSLKKLQIVFVDNRTTALFRYVSDLILYQSKVGYHEEEFLLLDIMSHSKIT